VIDRLQGNLSNMPVIAALLREGPRHSGKLCLGEHRTYPGERTKFSSWHSFSSRDWALWCLHSCFAPVPLPRCCIRDPLVCQIMTINLLFTFHVWFYGFCCILLFWLTCPSRAPRWEAPLWLAVRRGFSQCVLLLPFRIQGKCKQIPLGNKRAGCGTCGCAGDREHPWTSLGACCQPAL